MSTTDAGHRWPWRESALREMHNQCNGVLGELIESATSHADLWQKFRQFLAEVGTADSRRAEAKAIFSYAWHCFAWSLDEVLAEDVQPCFYEQVPTVPELAAVLPLVMPTWQFRWLEETFHQRLSNDDYREFRLGYFRRLAREPRWEEPGRWREVALEHVPGLRDLILTARSHLDLWKAFKDYLVDEGATDTGRLVAKSIFDYAWWCLNWSDDAHLASCAETWFYEDLPRWSDLAAVVPLYLAPWQFQRLEYVWYGTTLSAQELGAYLRGFYQAVREQASPRGGGAS